jgi:hypothetical protein
VSPSEDMLSMVWYDCMLTHLQASPLEVSPAKQDIGKANNDNAGDSADSAGGQTIVELAPYPAKKSKTCPSSVSL